MGKLLSSADGASWSVVREDLTPRNKFGFVRHGQHLLFMGGRGERPAHGRAELLAKRPHGRLRRLSAELENVGERRGKPPTF